jgi:hypothetical protein
MLTMRSVRGGRFVMGGGHRLILPPDGLRVNRVINLKK